MGHVPNSTTSRRRWPWLVGALVVVLALAGGGFAWQQRTQQRLTDDARALAEQLAGAVSAGDLSGVPVAGAGTTAQETYAAQTKGLGGSKAAASVASFTRDGDTAQISLAVKRTLPGGATWSYDLPVSLVHADSWQVAEGQPLVHPDLRTSEKLATERTQPDRADVLGGDGKPLVTPQPVVDVGIQPSRVKGSAASLARDVAGIVDVEAAPLAKRVQAAAASSFVDVITLRRDDYVTVRSRLRPLPGVVFREREQALAPTREFARALLGSVGPVTAEMVEKGEGRYAAGDVAGLSGLQRQYDEQLAGTAGVRVQAVPAARSTEATDSDSTDDSDSTAESDNEAAADPRTLFEVEAVPGTPLRLTLDERVQRAADASLAGLEQPGSLVAVEVKTGRVLAVANSPATGLNRALVGQYPPGSTFKVVTTLALLQKGLSPSDPVACPQSASVGGRSFRNYEKEAFGSVPFRTDFAKSCNTAFVALSARLDADDLKTTAASLGIGRTWKLGTDAFSGSIPTTTSEVDKAAASFGQGRNLVSPLALTVGTASVARGSYLAPSLVLSEGAAPAAAEPLPREPVQTLQGLMQDVVTGGTGSALRSVPGGPVRAKTGTAEFGTDSPPRTRAWITGWQGDIAFTAFVEEGRSGGTVAGPVAAAFLRALNG